MTSNPHHVLAFGLTAPTFLNKASTLSRAARRPVKHPRHGLLAVAAYRDPHVSSGPDDRAGERTVAAYLTPPVLGEEKIVKPMLDDLVEDLAADDDRPTQGPASGPSRTRRTAVSAARATTRAVHGGDRLKGGLKAKATLDSLQTPIVQTATYAFRCTQDLIDYNQGRYASYEYARYGNPTTRAVEEKLMALERAQDCVFAATGMSSVTTLLLTLVPTGGHIVVTTDCYRRTRQFVDKVLPRLGVSCSVLDPGDVDGLASILRDSDRPPALYFSESPTNPLMRVVDIPRIASLCRAAGTISVFDTTFATPYNVRPLEHGADLVLHSATKYLAGHQDVLAGALAGRADLISAVRDMQGVLGGTLDPHAAYLVNRGLKTLGLRMRAHNANAEAVARLLDGHEKIARVHFPGLSSHPDHATAQALFRDGCGGMLSFELKGDGDPWSAETFRAAGRFIDNLRIAYIGSSLGGVETIVEQVCLRGYFNEPERVRKQLGITNSLVRMSCGIEDTEDLLEDINMALSAV